MLHTAAFQINTTVKADVWVWSMPANELAAKLLLQAETKTLIALQLHTVPTHTFYTPWNSKCSYLLRIASMKMYLFI
jgi:hypothetical protein